MAASMHVQALPAITNASITLYANVPDPVTMAFAPDGTLYVGRDNSSSGGSSQDAVKIHRVAPGGAPVTPFGNVAIRDPDAVGYDLIGAVSGTPGAVLIGGTSGNGTAIIRKIAPNGTVSVLFGGEISSIGNPRQFLFDDTGRVYISDTSFNRIVTTASSAAPTVLCVSTGANAMAFDVNDRLAVASYTLPRIQLFSKDGTLLNENFAAILPGAPLAAGRGDSFWGRDLYTISPNFELIRIDPAGHTTVIGSGFGQSTQFAFGSDDALYISAQWGDRIYRVVEKIVDVPLPDHWWPGEGNALDVIADAHGFLTISDGYSTNTTTPKASYPPGVLGQCFHFDTNGSAFNFGTNVANVGTNDFTLAFWFKSTNSSTRGIFGKIPTACTPNTGWFVDVYNDGAIRLWIGEKTPVYSYKADAFSADKVADGQWHHVVCIRSNLNPVLYIDGVPSYGGHSGSAPASTAEVADIANGAQFVMGGENGAGNLASGWCYRSRDENDEFDEVQLYLTALSPDQVYKLTSLQANAALAIGPSLHITPDTSGSTTIGWTPAIPGYILQSSETLAPPNWVNAPSGALNPAMVPAPSPPRFYRLIVP